MNSFMKVRQPRRTVIYLPPTQKTDIRYDILMSPESQRSGEIYVERDGRRLVTVQKDGTVILHEHP